MSQKDAVAAAAASAIEQIPINHEGQLAVAGVGLVAHRAVSAAMGGQYLGDTHSLATVLVATAAQFALIADWDLAQTLRQLANCYQGYADDRRIGEADRFMDELFRETFGAPPRQ